MRIIFTFSIAIYGLLNYGLAQIHKEIPVPIVKENRKIDLLIEDFLNNDKTRNVFLNNKSCLTISFGKEKNSYHYCVVAIDNRNLVNNDINQLFNSTKNYGCFEYKGFQIFVSSPDKLDGLFSRTSSNKTFDYIYISQTGIDPRDRYKVAVYKYEKGKFSVDHSQ